MNRVYLFVLITIGLFSVCVWILTKFVHTGNLMVFLDSVSGIGAGECCIARWCAPGRRATYSLGVCG